MQSTAPDDTAPGASNASFERRLAECALQNEATARELAALGATLSHDLRAPLRSIEGFSQLLLQPAQLEQLDETGQDYLRRIHRASLHLSQMLDDMLQLVRLAQSGVKTESIDLTSMAHSILASLMTTLPARPNEIVIDPDLVLAGDSRLLHLVLENLLGNAWKFSSKNEVVRISMGRVCDEGVHAICVRDHGIGFEQRYADRLFRAFSRLHNDPPFDGIGMGLAKTQRAIHAQGGRIWARAQAGAGAAFYFTLPCLLNWPVDVSDCNHGED